MPSKPGNPSEGKANEPEQLEADAAKAKAVASQEAAEEKAEATEEAPQQVKKTRARKAAPKADEDKPKPARKPRAKKAEEPKAEEAKAEKPKAEKAKAEEKPAGKPGRSRRREAPERVVVRAHAKYVRTSARKARLVCDHIRGKDVAEARAILLHTNRQVAEAWSKLLESAIANAAENHSLDGEDLRVAFVVADEGPTLKRFRPRAMGRATKIRKRTSHLSIGLEPKE
jgi:ribosomal protein L22